jgi:DEAD/DEAH box helicase domain-containing protein
LSTRAWRWRKSWISIGFLRAQARPHADLTDSKRAPILAVAELDTELIAIAAADLAEAIPGPQWGLGQGVPLVYGIVGAQIGVQSIAADRLVTLSAGNARLLRLQNELDGGAVDFGARFWRLIETADPLSFAALKGSGVNSVSYTDRYLLNPLTIKLLYEVLRTAPGRTANTSFKISSAEQDRAERSGYMAFHAFSDDRQRQELLRALFPTATILVSPKTQLPHARCLELILCDGRCLRIILDQGFGAWRVEGVARHDFQLPPQKQAVEIERAQHCVRMSEKLGAPIVIELV